MALATVGTLPVASAESNKPDVLFSVRDYTRSGITYSGAGKNIKFLIEPFAYVSNGKLRNLPDNLDQKLFDRDYYANHRQYTLFAGGKPSGSVSVRNNAFGIQCDSLAAIGDATPPELISGMRMGLASNADFQAMQYTKRAPTDDERAMALKLALRIYAQNKAPRSATTKIRVTNITVLQGPNRSILVGSFAANTINKESGYDLSVTHAAFLVAEKIGEASYRATLKWFHAGEEAEVETQDLVDILDIDGDGEAEIITQFGYYEAVEYHVYRKTNGKWVNFYKQFGAGC
jgi:hypothetical protein